MRRRLSVRWEHGRSCLRLHHRVVFACESHTREKKKLNAPYSLFVTANEQFSQCQYFKELLEGEI